MLRTRLFRCLLIVLSLVTFLVAACTIEPTPFPTPSPIMSGDEAAAFIRAELNRRTFSELDGALGGTTDRRCGEYLGEFLRFQWDPEMKAWIVTFDAVPGHEESVDADFFGVKRIRLFEHSLTMVVGDLFPQACA